MRLITTVAVATLLVTALLASGSAYALTGAAPAAARSTGDLCPPMGGVSQAEGAPEGACFVQARASMGAGSHAGSHGGHVANAPATTTGFGGGGHASSHRGRHTANAPARTTGFGGKVIKQNRVDNRRMATDGNVTSGPNVAVSRDINDRRAVVFNGMSGVLIRSRGDGNVASRDINDRRAVLLNDGRVVVLSDRRAVGLNGTSGVLIRFNGD
jgi:hypothetical protein